MSEHIHDSSTDIRADEITVFFEETHGLWHVWVSEHDVGGMIITTTRFYRTEAGARVYAERIRKAGFAPYYEEGQDVPQPYLPLFGPTSIAATMSQPD